jgi:tripeptide aminopeptidase
VIGHDLVTASGKTLLGADDKAGVAIILSLAEHLLGHPEIERGPVHAAFVPDEEIGLRGAANLDLRALGANVAYTLDGHGVGEVVWECFSGDAAVVTIQGIATHPGEARKHRMVNAVHLAGKLLAALPREFTSPETTEMYQGYLHPLGIEGNAASVKIQFLLRDFTDAGLADKRRRLAGLCRGIQATEPRAKIRCEFTPSYRNMAKSLQQDRRPVDLALAAMRRVGVEPVCLPIRGATDGTRLSERGLPTPNLSCGEHNPHGPLEWVTRQDLEVCAQACLELVRLWAEQGAGYQGYRHRGAPRRGRA